MDKDDLPDLMAFGLIAEERSFKRAAAKLGVSRSSLSRTIRRLEDRLGATLLHRTTRSVAPTDAGRRLQEKLAPALMAIADAVDAVDNNQARPSGRVRICAHHEAALLQIAPKLPTLRGSEPGVVLEVIVDEGLIDIVAAGFDAGVRPGELLAKDMVAVRIGPERKTALVAAPGYLAGRALVSDPDDLGGHDQIGYRLTSSGVLAAWSFRKGDRDVRVRVDPVFASNDIDLILQAASDGVGLAYVLRRQAEVLLSSGVLTSVLDDWAITVESDFLYYPSRRQVSPALRSVIELLRWREPILS